MVKKLPRIISQEEFEKLFEEVIKLESKAKKKSHKERIKEYRIAMLLGFEAGLRISEIVGLRKEISSCCKAHIIEKREKINDKKILNKYCSKCNSIITTKQIIRSKTEWDIYPLTKEQIEVSSIRILQGKGKKDRTVSRPKRFNKSAIDLLPLNITRRALQFFIVKLGKKVLNKSISFHTLRHGFATHFYNKTKNILGLQQQLGHSRTDTTSIYAHINPEETIKQVQDVF